MGVLYKVYGCTIMKCISVRVYCTNVLLYCTHQHRGGYLFDHQASVFIHVPSSCTTATANGVVVVVAGSTPSVTAGAGGRGEPEGGEGDEWVEGWVSGLVGERVGDMVGESMG